MFKNVDIYTKRYIQITFAYMLFVALEEGSNFPHSTWITITGCMIYIGFNPGTVLKRSYLRLPGTLVGVCAMALMWYVIHLDYRMAIFFMAFIAWAMVYFFSLPYNYYVIVTTMFSDIGIEWSNTSTFSLQYYIVDRVMCTLLVFGICIVLEYFWFGRDNFTELSYFNIRKQLLNEIRNTERSIDQEQLSRAKLFRLVGTTRKKWLQMRIFLNDAKYEKDRRILADDFPHKISCYFRSVVNIWHIQHNYPQSGKLARLRTQAHHDAESIR
jgi:hypothetical protein